MIVGAAGRLSPEKGFETLIRAADRLLSLGGDFDLVIVGEGGEEARLRKLVDELGRGDRIRLLGYRTDMPEVFRAMDIFALSSLREGLPNVLLEAMASSVPVVATEIAGIPRLVADGQNGLLVPAGSEDALAQGLGLLLADADLRRLGRQGRLTVEGAYSFTARIKKLRAIYDDLLETGSPEKPTALRRPLKFDRLTKYEHEYKKYFSGPDPRPGDSRPPPAAGRLRTSRVGELSRSAITPAGWASSTTGWGMSLIASRRRRGAGRGIPGLVLRQESALGAVPLPASLTSITAGRSPTTNASPRP